MKQMKTISRLVLIAVFLLSVGLVSAQPTLAAATVMYIAPGGLTGGACDSWANACDLQYGLTSAAAGSELWVKAGTYRPTITTDRTISFQLKNGVALYGGFATDAETLRSQRDFVANVTVLSGDIGVVGDASDNSYHIVVGSGVDATSVLDGFTITDGNTNGSGPSAGGAGMYNSGSSPTLANLIFSNNTGGTGGGAGLHNTGSSPTLTNVTFTNNSAALGGGMSNQNASNPTLTNVTFSNNTAIIAGGMENEDSNPILTNVTFSGNFANRYYGGMANFNSSPTLTDVTFNANSAPIGGGMSNISNSHPTLTRVVFSNNTIVAGDGSYTGTRSGAGMYNDASSPILTDVTFSGNSALPSVTFVGGGMSNVNHSNPTLTNVTFSNNSAPIAGGMWNEDSSPLLTNVTFNGNSGDGMENYNASPTLTNVTFSGNSGMGGAMTNSLNSNPVIVNSILWGNTPGSITDTGGSVSSVSYSIVQGGFAGSGNLSADPLLGALANNGGFTQTMALGAGSPAIDAGNLAACAATDQRGVARPQGSGCDMGAFELEQSTPTPTLTPILTVIPTETDTPTLTPTRTVSPTPTVTPTSIPGADFFGAPLSGSAPLAVQFTALNVSMLSQCTWTFGDGASETFTPPAGQQHFPICPSTNHVYDSVGSFTVSLSVTKYTNGYSNSMTKPNYIQVSAPAPTSTPTGARTTTATPSLTITRTPTRATVTRTFSSVATQDGWVLELGENSNSGGSMNSAAVTFQLGDDAANRQYRAILSFDTSGLPDNAILSSVTLKIMPGGAPVGKPNLLGKLWVDIRKGPFGAPPLQLGDFNAAASALKVGAFDKTPPATGWYSAALNPAGRSNINKTGLTQFRLYFALDDNNNRIADFMKFLSGNALSNKPVLVITYTVP